MLPGIPAATLGLEIKVLPCCARRAQYRLSNGQWACCMLHATTTSSSYARRHYLHLCIQQAAGIACSACFFFKTAVQRVVFADHQHDAKADSRLWSSHLWGNCADQLTRCVALLQEKWCKKLLAGEKQVELRRYAIPNEFQSKCLCNTCTTAMMTQLHIIPQKAIVNIDSAHTT